MKAVKKGKDGRLYFGKGTKGGLAPQPVQSGVNISNVSIPGLNSPKKFEAPLVGGKYSYLDLFNNGFTREEVNIIESASPTGSRPNYTAQGLLMQKLNERKYGEDYDKYSAANTLAVAMKEQTKKILPLPEAPADRYEALRTVSPIYLRLVAEVANTAYNYNRTEKDSKNSLYSPGLIEFAEKINKNNRGGDYAALQTGDDGKLYLSHESSAFLAAYEREVKDNEYVKRHVDEDINFYTDMANKYNNGEKGYSNTNSYINQDRVKPSEALVAARIETAYAEKELRKAEEKSSKGFLAAIRGGSKSSAVKKAEIELINKKNRQNTLENMDRILDIL